MLVLKIAAFLVCFLGISCNPTSTRRRKYEIFENDILLSDLNQKRPTWDPVKKTEGDAWDLLQSHKYLWPKGRIPYKIAANKFDHYEMLNINKAIKHIEDRTCIDFVLKGNQDVDYVLIDKPKIDVCNSFVGKQGGEQLLNLGYSCFQCREGIVVHELLHAIGLWHEQGRPDRDDYVDILWDNVDKSRAKGSVPRSNYFKRSWGHINDACEDYDYLSIMHYNLTDSAIKDKTIAIKNPPQNFNPNKVGNRLKMSFTDTQKINRMYRCHDVNCWPHCPKPPKINDYSKKCSLVKNYNAREKCLKKLAQVTYCY